MSVQALIVDSAEVSLSVSEIGFNSAEIRLDAAEFGFDAATFMMFSAEIRLDAATLIMFSAEITLDAAEKCVMTPVVGMFSGKVSLDSAEMRVKNLGERAKCCIADCEQRSATRLSASSPALPNAINPQPRGLVFGGARPIRRRQWPLRAVCASVVPNTMCDHRFCRFQFVLLPFVNGQDVCILTTWATTVCTCWRANRSRA